MREPFSSWLWHWLHNVMPRHPLHFYRYGTPPLSPLREWGYRGVSSVLPLVLFINTGVLLFDSTVFMPLVALPLALITAASGVTTSSVITGSINREREQGRYDLMGLAPSGLIGAGWVLAVRQMRNNLHILYLKQLARRAYVGVLLMMLLVVAGYWASYVDIAVIPPRPSFLWVMLPAWNALLLLGILLMDYFQSLVGAGLLGMLVPTFTHSRLEGLFYTLTVFLLMQVLVYLAATLAWGVAGLFGLTWGLAPPVAAGLTLFGVREGVNAALLRLLLQRANADSDELAVTLRSGL